MWVNNGAYTLNCRDREVVLSRRGWLTDKIICAAQMMLLQFFPNMAGLQPPTLQRVFAFQVHSGEFVQIIHVRNNHWCVVSTVGSQSGVVRVYDSLYKTLSKETEYLIASMVHVPSSDLQIVMMDVDKQSNGSDCGVLAIAYVFDICSGGDPCTVRFDHSKIRSHLATCLENCQVSRFSILGDRESVQRKPKTVELHCSYRMPEEEGDEMAMCDSCHIWITATVWTFQVRCLMRTQRSTGSVRGVCSQTPRPVPLVRQPSLRADPNGVSSYCVYVPE